jgi:Family of unknown function (DUF6178)
LFGAGIAIIAALMAKSESLIERLRQTPDLAHAIPQLHPSVLHRVITRCGLEDCADVIALATPAQISRVLDTDVWRAPKAGVDEQLDADRFGLWIEALMQSGAGVAAEKLPALDLHLIVAGLTRHVAVFDVAATSPYTTLDGEHVTPARAVHGPHACEVGGYVVEARRAVCWDAIVELLQALDAERPEYFHLLMSGCRRLSSGRREPDASHGLLEDDEQEMFELASARESRREREGYVSPAQARAFLQTARQLDLSGGRPSGNPVVRAYFGALEPEPAAESEPDHGAAVAAVPGVSDVLREEGVFAPAPRALLGSGSETAPSRMRFIQAFADAHAVSGEELAYLANSLMAGCSLQARPFTQQEASDAAVALCNLGLENWPRSWGDRDLVSSFEVGMTVLHRDVCMFVAERVLVVLGDLQCRDRDIQMGLSQLRAALAKHTRGGVPWRAARALDVILLLDAPSWAALVGLIGEFPVMHGAIAATVGPEPTRVRAVDAEAFEFVSENSQIALIREFLRRLPAALI